MPEPILVAIATALAGKSVGTLYDLVKKKFTTHKPATTALEAATGAAPDSPEVQTLAEQLAEATATDPTFAEALHTTWNNLHPEAGATINQISGTVHGNVVQAQEIQGGITFNH